MSLTWLIFETIGTVAFAFSGAMTALTKKMDIFGVVVLAVMCGTGGGMLRDVLAGITPPLALRSAPAFTECIATALFVSFCYQKLALSHSHQKWIVILYLGSDACGLAAFTVTGALTALYTMPEYPYLVPVILGLLTAVGGGILRDIMAQRVPVILKTDVYAIAAVAGGLVVCLVWHLWDRQLASWAGFYTVLILRALAIRFRWRLYRPHPHD